MCPLPDRPGPAGGTHIAPYLRITGMLAFSAFTGYSPLDYCIYACVVAVIGSLKLWSKNPSFFQKYTWMAGLDRHSFLIVFLLHFTFLILEFLKKIGHTGIAGTKKWLDQAVFPCWSNYHTLAGE